MAPFFGKAEDQDLALALLTSFSLMRANQH
jgi:hypothetical protein